MTSARALIVDDDPSHAKPLGRRLEFAGLGYDVASTGEEALELFNDQVLVLVDLSLPGMSGIEVARALNQANPRSSIVLLSAHDDLIAEAKSQDLSVSGVFEKPLTDKHLAALDGLAQLAIRRGQPGETRRAAL